MQVQAPLEGRGEARVVLPIGSLDLRRPPLHLLSAFLKPLKQPFFLPLQLGKARAQMLIHGKVRLR